MPQNTEEKNTKQASISSRINELYSMSLKELKARYKEFYSEENPASNKEYLVRQIAYKLQENIYGKLSEKAQSKLEKLKTELDPLKNLGRSSHSQKDDAKSRRRLPIPGTTITKIYKGITLNVKVLQKGFEYNGKEYRTLTRVAEEVTGVHQSGFVFFGL